MFNVCYSCGAYRADKIIDSSGPDAVAVCPECGYRHSFRYLPLMLISGASGAGKSTICQLLTGTLQDVVLLDSDILWRPEFDRPEEGYRDFFETWLRLSRNIAQSGRPVVLFGAGMGVPTNIEPCIERRYFSATHYLALTCEDELLRERLRARPAWRGSSEEDFIEEQLRFNHWFLEAGASQNPPVALLDTSAMLVDEAAARVAAWIRVHAKQGVE